MAFDIALSGLNAAAKDLQVTGNNIANANTTGFKWSRIEFADLVTSSLTTAVNPGGGVKVSNVAQQFSQGTVGFTENNLDLAISGEGFFVLSNNGSIEFTRAGAFNVDRDGFIVSSNGDRLQGFTPVQNGGTTTFNTGSLSDIQLQTSEAPPQATGLINASINLKASTVAPTAPFDPNQPTTFNHFTSLTLFDSQGAQHTGTFYFVSAYDGVDPTTANQWKSYLFVDGENVSTDGDGAVTPPAYESIDLVFNPDGSIASAGGNASGQFTFDNFSATVAGADPLAMTVDFTEVTQFGSPFTTRFMSQDGFTSGRLVGLDVSREGIMFTRFSNGQSQQIAQVAMARFTNQQGLTPLGENKWGETFASNSPITGAAGSGSFGDIQSRALEGSNVDLAEQLVNLIVAQRSFQANAKSISTEDEITQTIINLSR